MAAPWASPDALGEGEAVEGLSAPAPADWEAGAGPEFQVRYDQ